MNIRSLLLGSIAAAGLSTAGYAADLGVVTSLDVCDELGLSGLTISSDDNCLVITGGVSFEYSLGNFADGTVLTISGDSDNVLTNEDNGTGDLNSDLDIDAWLKFVASAPSDFGPATATIKIGQEDISNGNTTWDVDVLEAWVGIGDTTVIMAGLKSSIFNDGDDGALNYLGLFGGDIDVFGPSTGGAVIQVVSNLGNGLSIGGGIENLQNSGPAAEITGVGVLSYAGDGITAHISGAVDEGSDWKIHAGFTGAWDPIKVVGAFGADDSGYWEALGSVSATFDIFTLALSGEANADSEWGVGGSVSAVVSEGVTLNVGGRWYENQFADTAGQVEAGVSAAVTETITLTAAVGMISGTEDPTLDNFYGKAGLAWAPGGGFTSSINGEVNSIGAYKATFKAAKEIK